MECERFWWDTNAWDARFLSGGDFKYWTVDEKIKSTPLRKKKYGDWMKS